jgi:hypothetical protein
MFLKFRSYARELVSYLHVSLSQSVMTNGKTVYYGNNVSKFQVVYRLLHTTANTVHWYICSVFFFCLSSTSSNYLISSVFTRNPSGTSWHTPFMRDQLSANSLPLKYKRKNCTRTQSMSIPEAGFEPVNLTPWLTRKFIYHNNRIFSFAN